MSLNFGINVGVLSDHHRHPNTVEAAELLQECIRFFGPLCIFCETTRTCPKATKCVVDKETPRIVFNQYPTSFEPGRSSQ